MRIGLGFCAGIIALSFSAAGASEAPALRRSPQYPLKTGRQIFTDEAIARARENVARYESAKAIVDRIIANADTWLEWTAEDLEMLMPPAQTPRAFNVGTAGCPDCGTRIYEKGTYPWILDLKQPFKVKCPLCDAVFPDNDYAAYYKSGYSDKRFLEGKYSDDGWGWVGPPDDHRYWFVAYANHWTWHGHVLPGLQDLGRAYLFTGDTRYARQAALMLYRLAHVYPDMDHPTQSRYGQLMAARGEQYRGKIVNHIWETMTLTRMAEAYDAVWDAIDADAELQRIAGASGEAIRAAIEANVLEEGIDEVFSGEIRGNFGMHQRALVYAALARQNGPSDEWIGGIFTQSGVPALNTGLNYALYNLVFRDGAPYETAPGYNFIWVSAITQIAETLQGAAWDVYAMPKTRLLYDAVLDVVNAGAFTPALGDSGSVYGGRVTDATTFQAAYRAFDCPRYLEHLNELGVIGDASFRTFESLFRPAVEVSEEKSPPQRSRLLDGYGMAILNNPADTISAAMYYGYAGGHGHSDRLHFELFAHGQPVMPDLGYPDFMNIYVSGICTWSKNTIAHNTVTVDAGRQPGNCHGTVNLFVDTPFARVVDVDAPATYPQCLEYRRHLVMVDAGDDRSYYVDFFAVRGGNQHDYSLHGPPGVCEIVGGEWRVQETGTLAGEDVPLGMIYDDPVRGAEDYAGEFYGYHGSGFQHMVNVRRHAGGEWLAHYTHEKDPAVGVRIRMLPETDTECILTDAQVSPIKQKQLITYLLARREGASLSSRFAAVMEPFRDAPFLADARRIDLDGGATAIVVTHISGDRDVVLFNPERAAVTLQDHGLGTDAFSVVLRLDPDGRPSTISASAGTFLSLSGERYELPAPIVGEVVSVHPAERQIRIRLDRPDVSPTDLTGRVAHFVNDARRTAHPVADVALSGEILDVTTGDDLLVGRARITAVETQAVATDTAFMFAPVYDGAYASDAHWTAYHRVDTVAGGAIRLAQSLPDVHGFEIGADAWIVNVGPGDRLDIPPVLFWRRD